MADKIFTKEEIKVWKWVETLLSGNEANGHGMDHTNRVLQMALDIAENYSEADSSVITLAALLHDVDDYKLFNTTNNANARKIMHSNGIFDETIEKVCDIINEVSFSHGTIPQSIEGKIVQDADRLDAMGAIGIARAFAYGGSVGNSFNQTIQHFYDKLLKLKDLMNTSEAKKEASIRHMEMVIFLDGLKIETAEGLERG